MKFFSIENPKEFLNRVLRCSGEIYCVGIDGTEQDLKKMSEYLIKSGLAVQMKEIEEINLIVKNPKDKNFLMNYAMEMRIAADSTVGLRT